MPPLRGGDRVGTQGGRCCASSERGRLSWHAGGRGLEALKVL